MRVPDEAGVLGEELELGLRVEAVEDVLPVAGGGRRGMDEDIGLAALREGEGAQVIAVLRGEHFRGPERGGFRVRIEPRDLRTAARGGIVVAQEHQLAALPDDVQAFVRAAAVPDRVPEAQDPVRAALVHGLQDRLQRLQIRVYVGKKRRLHPGGRTSWASRSRMPFTKAPEVSMPYFLAISIASSSATRTGTSAW